MNFCDISLVVTPGEKSLIAELNKQGVEFVTENLLVGDIHIRRTLGSGGCEEDESTVLFIFERKSKGDLYASIKDGRYREQKARLCETGVPRSRIIYIIENFTAWLADCDKTAKKAAWSAICNSTTRDGFGVFQTTNVAQTAEYLSCMLESTTKHPLYSIGESMESETSASKQSVGDVNVEIKKRAVKPEEWFAYSLTLIPGVSKSIADVIAGHFGSFEELKAAYSESAGKDKSNKKENAVIRDLKHGSAQRRVGEKLEDKVKQYVLSC